MERELLDRGIARVTVTGLPDLEVAIQVPVKHLIELKRPLNHIASRIRYQSQDIPAGILGRNEMSYQVRSLEQKRTGTEFESLTVISRDTGQVLRLGDIAIVELRPQDGEVTVTHNGEPAVVLTLYRTDDSSTLKSATILKNWYQSIQPKLGNKVKVHIFDERWQYVKDRINLLLKNGLGGLILIIAILFLCLNRSVAFWIFMGIPTAFLAALAALYGFGGTINMVSLFAFIMMLGVIVDDTIVVGEEALSLHQRGLSPLASVEVATRKMGPPILASSLTTLCAFLPLMLISDDIGTILFAIPLIVVCVIIASLIECFFVLPGHLYHSFSRNEKSKRGKLRDYINSRFDYFREGPYKRFVHLAINYRGVTVATALAMALICLGLVVSGRINFTFFPAPDGSILYADVKFTASTSPQAVDKFLQQLNGALQKTNDELSPKNRTLIVTTTTYHNQTNYPKEVGRRYGSVGVELIQPDKREVSNSQFMNAWRHNIQLPPGVESFSILAPRGGPPGRDIDIQLTDSDPATLKKAAIELKEALHSYEGVSDVTDNQPFGREQLIYELTPVGQAIDLNIDEVGRQLRAAFEGELAQIFHLPNDEVEVRVMLPDEERHNLSVLEQLPIVTNSNNVVPLRTAVKLTQQQGIAIIRHTNTEVAINVQAEVNPVVTNSNKVLQDLEQTTLPKLVRNYGVKYNLEGRSQEQADTLKDMKYGMILAIALIYIVMSFVFSSYG